MIDFDLAYDSYLYGRAEVVTEPAPPIAFSRPHQSASPCIYTGLSADVAHWRRRRGEFIKVNPISTYCLHFTYLERSQVRTGALPLAAEFSVPRPWVPLQPF